MSLFSQSSPPATVRQGCIIQNPRLRSTRPANIHFPFPGARIVLQIALGCGKHLVCVCGCVSHTVRKGFLFLPSDSAAPLLASLECQPAHTITPLSRLVSGCNDRGIQWSEDKYFICGFMPGIAWILDNLKCSSSTQLVN